MHTKEKTRWAAGCKRRIWNSALCYHANISENEMQGLVLGVEIVSERMDIFTSIIYYELFGQTRDQLIAHVRKHPDFEFDAAYYKGDLDEVLRDHLSKEALTALANVEGYVTMQLGIRTPRTHEKIVALVQDIARTHRQTTTKIPLWYNDKDTQS